MAIQDFGMWGSFGIKTERAAIFRCLSAGFHANAGDLPKCVVPSGTDSRPRGADRPVELTAQRGSADAAGTPRAVPHRWPQDCPCRARAGIARSARRPRQPRRWPQRPRSGRLRRARPIQLRRPVPARRSCLPLRGGAQRADTQRVRCPRRVMGRGWGQPAPMARAAAARELARASAREPTLVPASAQAQIQVGASASVPARALAPARLAAGAPELAPPLGRAAARALAWAPASASASASAPAAM